MRLGLAGLSSFSRPLEQATRHVSFWRLSCSSHGNISSLINHGCAVNFYLSSNLSDVQHGLVMVLRASHVSRDCGSLVNSVVEFMADSDPANLT